MNDEWRTPRDLFERLDREFDLEWDAACDSQNCLPMNGCFEHGDDSLKLNWSEHAHSIWLNPPYSRGNIEPFMEKAAEQFQLGCHIVCLIRMDPSTQWFQEYVDGVATEIRMLSRRVRFQGAPSAYNFPCCVVIYDPEFGPHKNPIAIRTDYQIWDWKDD